MSVAHIDTQCVGGRPFFRVGLKPGTFPKLKPLQPSLLGGSSVSATVLLPMVLFHTHTTTPLALWLYWNPQLEVYPK